MLRRDEEILIHSPGHDEAFIDRLVPALLAIWGDTVSVGGDPRTRDIESVIRSAKENFVASLGASGFHIFGRDKQRISIGLNTAERMVRRVPTGQMFSRISIGMVGLKDPALASRLLITTSELADAWFGYYTPEPSGFLLAVRLGAYGADDVHLIRASKKYARLRASDLPKLSAFTHTDWPNPRIPIRLGWLNYWSSSTCTELGFPNRDGDAELFAHSQRTEKGALVLQLTPEPLDLSLNYHVEATERAYKRFWQIGQ